MAVDDTETVQLTFKDRTFPFNNSIRNKLCNILRNQRRFKNNQPIVDVIAGCEEHQKMFPYSVLAYAYLNHCVQLDSYVRHSVH